jgi:hypothetical protein
VAKVITEPAVLPAEIEQLPDLTGYVRFASNPLWYRCKGAIRRRQPLPPTLINGRGHPTSDRSRGRPGH